ncbi:MAG: glutathione S-transferase [Rhodoferax sp.]|nr:glutathione S-transferase [Rhodoferax sp.]
MMHIWGRLSSINVRKVIWAAQETGEPFERTDAGAAFGIVKTADYLRMNPHGLVPVLQDGDATLWESNVIVRYLAARFPHCGLLPASLTLRFEAEQWMDWQQTTFNGAGRDAFIQWIRTPAEQRNPELIARSVAATEPLLGLLEEHLSGNEWMVGDRFSMADIPLGCEIHRWFGLPQPRRSWPHLERWYVALCARPASRGVLDLQLS